MVLSPLRSMRIERCGHIVPLACECGNTLYIHPGLRMIVGRFAIVSNNNVISRV